MKKLLNSLLIFGLVSNVAISASAWVKQPKQTNNYNKKTESQTNGSDVKTQVDYAYNGHEYVGTNNNLWRSDKIGIKVAHWSVVGTGDIVKIYEYNKVLYIVEKSPSGGNTLWYSTNNGLNWAQSTSIPSGTINKIYGFNNIVYVSVYNSVDYLYKSTDGENFTSTKWPNDVEINDIYGYKNKLFIATNKGLYISTNDAKTFSIEGNNVIKHIYEDTYEDKVYLYLSQYDPNNNEVSIAFSDNFGTSWVAFQNWPTDNVINDINFYGKFIYVASDDGIWFKKYNETDPTSWVHDGHDRIQNIVVNKEYVFASHMNAQGDWDGIYRGVVFPLFYKTVWHTMHVHPGVIRSMYVANDEFHFCQGNTIIGFVDNKELWKYTFSS